MKKLTKSFISVASIAAVSAAMTVSAMAAEVTAEYNKALDDGSVTITVQNTTGASQTLLVLNSDAETVAEGDIAQIDQKDDGTSFTSFKLPAGIYAALSEGESKTYYIRIGGSDGTIQRGTLTISKTSGSGNAETIIVGDCNLDGTVTIMDATNLARQQARLTTRIGHVGETFAKADNSGDVIIGDCNLDGTVTIMDATNLARQQARLTTRIGHVGETVEVIKE